MKKIYTTVILLLFSVSIISCSKDDDVNPSAIEGEYKFIGMTSDVTTDGSTVSEGMTVRSVTRLKYESENNTGTMSFKGENLNTTNVGYYAYGTIYSQSYFGSEAMGPYESEFELTVPPSSSKGKFKVVGTDSISFEAGTMQINNQQLVAKPGGAKFKVEGDILTLSMSVSQSQKVYLNGYSMDAKASGKVTIKLQRQ